jgi:NAD(P)H-hydrate epimerase
MPEPGAVPFVTTDQMRAINRLLVDVYGISMLQTIENAGRNVARAVRRLFLGGNPQGKRIVVLAGIGGNGSGGLVAARRLIGWGAEVEVWLTALREDYERTADHELRTLEVMEARVRGPELEPHVVGSVVVDALVGSGLSGAPKGRVAELIRAANASGVPILAMDVPSGVDANSGTVHDPAIKAAATVAIGLPKRGLRDEEARRYVGDLYVADVGIPPALFNRPEVGIRIGPIFAEHEILPVWERTGAGPPAAGS